MEIAMNHTILMTRILQENYSLGEIEERFDATTDQLADGLDVYVEDNFDHVATILREDLFDLEV